MVLDPFLSPMTGIGLPFWLCFALESPCEGEMSSIKVKLELESTKCWPVTTIFHKYRDFN